MGLSLPPPAEFDLVGSFARRRGSEVELMLSQPKIEVPDHIVVLLTRGKSSVTATGELSEGPVGPRITVRAPRRELSDGTWNLAVRTGPDTTQRLTARLLVQGERPLVLLWGAKDPQTTIPDPRAAAKRRAAATAGRALDRALSVLPEPQAKKIRAQARTTARKVLH